MLNSNALSRWRNMVKDKKFIFGILIVLSVGLLLFVVLELFAHVLPISKSHDGIVGLYSASLIILTMVLAWVGWSQLRGLKQQAESDFLLRIDQRWSSSEIVRARVIIHRIYIETKDSNDVPSIHQNKMANKIVDISQSKKPSDIEDFAHLLNFLDFLETASYFCNHKKINKKEV